MIVETFLLLLTTLSIITGLVTEGVKKALDSFEMNYASNIVALFVAVFIGGAGTIVFYLFNGIAFTGLNIICIFLMMIANWLGAMIGYDKVIQAIKQIKC